MPVIPAFRRSKSDVFTFGENTIIIKIGKTEGRLNTWEKRT